jgi:hypothetical protein
MLSKGTMGDSGAGGSRSGTDIGEIVDGGPSPSAPETR